MIRGVHHVSITTSNLERLVEFYCRVLGFAEVQRYGWEGSELIDTVVGLENSATRAAMLRAGNCYLEVFEYSRPAPRTAAPLRPCDPGYTHICLDVVEIHEEYRRLSAAGMEFNREPVDFGTLWAAYGRDPDGNIVEIQETKADQVFSLDRLQMLHAENSKIRNSSE